MTATPITGPVTDPGADAAVRADDRGHVFHSWSAQALIDPLPVAGGAGATFWDYAGNGYVWEGGAAVVPGPYWLTASVHANDGRVVSYRWDIDVQ